MEQILTILLILAIIALVFILILFAEILYDDIVPNIIYFINKRKIQKTYNKKLIELEEQHYDVLYEIQKGLELGIEVDDELIEDLYAQADRLEDKIERLKE